MPIKKFLTVASAAVLGSAVLASTSAVAAGEQFMPIPSYRVGPYAAGGTGIYGGFIDYMQMLNERDGGINGVKLTWEECETEYKTDRAVECYERLKAKGSTGASMFHFLSTGATYAAIDRATKDKIPVVSTGYGRTDASDGRVFPYVFPLITNYWSQNTAKIRFIGMQEGGMGNLKGKTIVNLHHGSGYGRETISVLDVQAKKFGFKVVHIEVPHPGAEQQSQWLQIRRIRPDWVILRGWGVMNPTAIKQAARIGFPRTKMLGVWWSGAEEDVVPAGKAAKGYIAAGFHPGGTSFPAIQDIINHVYNKGKGNLADENRVGSIYWNRGVIIGALSTEAIRKAQEKYGNKPLTGEQIRWGLENLDLDNAGLEKLGLGGLMQPIKVSCFDHEGGGSVKFQQWNGSEWNVITDWIKSDQSIVRPMIEKSAAKYAKEKGITPRNCS